MSSLMTRESTPASRRAEPNQWRRAWGVPGMPARSITFEMDELTELPSMGPPARFGVPDVGGEPPAPPGHDGREVFEDGVQGYLSFFVAFPHHGDGVDVVALDGGDLADPEAGVSGEQDHRPRAFVHPGVQQDHQVLVGDRAGSALLDLRGGRDGGGVVGAAAGDDEPLAPGPDRAVVVGPGGFGPGGRGQEPVHALRGDGGGVGDSPDDGEPVGDGFVGHAAATLPEHPVLQQLVLNI